MVEDTDPGSDTTRRRFVRGLGAIGAGGVLGTGTAGALDDEYRASHDATIVGTNTPVHEGETVEVTAKLRNVNVEGGDPAEVRLLVDGEQRDAIQVVDGTVTFSWETGEGAAGPHTATIDTNYLDDSAPVAVVSESDPLAVYDIEIQGTNSPVVEGEDLEVTTSIENLGTGSGPRTVALSTYGDVRVEREVSIDPGDRETVTFTWGTEVGDGGAYRATVEPATRFDLAEHDFTSVAVEYDADPSLSLAPSTFQEVPGETTTVYLVVDDVPVTVGSYDVRVGVADPSVASIVDVTQATDTGFEDGTIEDDGTLVNLRTFGLELDTSSGPVVLAGLSVECTGEGTTTLELEDVSLTDEGGSDFRGRNYEHLDLAIENAEVTLTEDAPSSSRDLNGDGLHRDVNGDGEFTVADVQTLFARREEESMQGSADLFDFSGSDPEELTIGDVQALFSDFQNWPF